LEKIT
jgi:hypothetical protein